ncbi:preprotein translocase subunit SecG [Desulfoprunum benzoelyticum]|uniref:Protein-export membrane protein SecG n=1 Tax=Desulfoprunum benzoelyticum TaxID=1506996 RepID=A0A840UQ24_9BACT|nr:preprotein translocase subunit SecG [Desulfoprunum benzoelyticum]MBB5347882.1 preprotein translocase subunit SecG [Desulfoprunum benzoelyticum]MBM9530361.1 preprotein translocase subunit SecG [Desulfoprunum benzoelyticum]
METLLIVLHVVVCLFLIGIVLLQHGKGADIGATFGGSSQSLFGSEGPLPLLNKITTAVAVIFMLTSVALAYISSHTGTDSVMSGLTKPEPVQTTQPPAPVQTEPVGPQPAGDTMPIEPAKAPEAKTDAPPAATPAAPEKTQ